MSTKAFDALKARYRAGLLGENFKLDFIEWNPEPAEGRFPEAVADSLWLRGELARKAGSLGWQESFVPDIKSAYIERFSSGLVASYAMALELFEMEEDNWFKFESARDASAWFAEPAKMAERRELILLKGINTRPIMHGLIVPPDLIVGADYGAQALAFLIIGLAD